MDIKCSRCNILKDESLFNSNKSKKTGKQSYCRDCQKEFDKAHYQKSEKRRISTRQRQNQNFEENKIFILNYLKTHPCVDCGESDPIVLEFDHMRDKLKNISDMRRSYSLNNIILEIEKCEIRCANCHKRKHYDHRGFCGYII